MNRTLCNIAWLSLLPLAALAAEPPQQAPAPPPPDMDAPAVKAVPVEKSATGTDAKGAEATDANGETAPVVTVRKQGNDTVEEYRRDGRITMIRITPEKGVAQTYIANGDGKLVRDAKQGPVDPVYFTVYQWK